MMSDHVHLLLSIPTKNSISQIMDKLKTKGYVDPFKGYIDS